MTLSLNTIKPQKGAKKNRKRVGRGNSSGHGTYSTRGLKGQKSRSGVSGLKRLGLKKQLLQIPKERGFKSKFLKTQAVNLGDINLKFKDGDEISPKSLSRKGLIKQATAPIKILGKGEFTLKKLTFKDVKMSESAKNIVNK